MLHRPLLSKSPLFAALFSNGPVDERPKVHPTRCRANTLPFTLFIVCSSNEQFVLSLIFGCASDGGRIRRRKGFLVRVSSGTATMRTRKRPIALRKQVQALTADQCCSTSS